MQWQFQVLQVLPEPGKAKTGMGSWALGPGGIMAFAGETKSTEGFRGATTPLPARRTGGRRGTVVAAQGSCSQPCTGEQQDEPPRSRVESDRACRVRLLIVLPQMPGI